jgi:hypothetical protein
LAGAAKHRIRRVIQADIENRFCAKGREVRTLHERPMNKKRGAQLILRSREGECPTEVLLIDAARDHIELIDGGDGSP